MKAICYKQAQRIKQNSTHSQNKTQSGIQQRAPLGLLIIIRLINSAAKSKISLVQNIKRCSFYLAAALEDFEDKGLIRVKSKAKTFKEKKTVAETLAVFGIYSCHYVA